MASALTSKAGSYKKRFLLSLFLTVLALPSPLTAESGYDAWLRFAPIDAASARERYNTLPANAVALGDSVVIKTTQADLIRGVRGMLGRKLRVEANLPQESAIILGTFATVSPLMPAGGLTTGLALRRGDRIRIEGFPDGEEHAPLDYIEIHAQ